MIERRFDRSFLILKHNFCYHGKDDSIDPMVNYFDTLYEKLNLNTLNQFLSYLLAIF